MFVDVDDGNYFIAKASIGFKDKYYHSINCIIANSNSQ